MSSPLEQAGATKEPSEYATLSMDRAMTGLWTQRSPLRDADVPYLYGKFYSASRFDSLIDGINREITARLTDARRPGSSVYNSNTFPGINSFYPYKSIQNGSEVVRLLADGKDGNIYDATAGQKSTLFAKTAGAGKARFCGVNTELFFTDGVDLKKWLFPGGWQAAINVQPGTLINVGAEPGNMQMALGGISLPLVAYSSSGGIGSPPVTTVTLYVDPQNVPNQFPNLLGVDVTFAGTGVGYLDGDTYPVASIVSTTLGIFTIDLIESGSAIAETSITGTGTTGTGTTGATIPTFSATEFTVVADGGQQWKCYGPAIENWGLQVPANAPTLAPLNGTRFWQPNTTVGAYYSVLDPDGNIQATISGGKTGASYPVWTGGIELQVTTDGTVRWQNLGKPGTWMPSFSYPGPSFVILDSNGNLQDTQSGSTTGVSAPTWATTVGATTNDGSYTWVCLGPGTVYSTASIQYAFSTHAIDGSVSTASPIATIPGGILGPAETGILALIQIAGNLQITTSSGAGTGSGGLMGAIIPVRNWNFSPAPDPQIDQIWIWRTAQGQPTLILEDQIPADGPTTSFTYNEIGIPDTSTNGGGALIPEIPAPIAGSNNPPPLGITAPVFHLGRIAAILNNTVVMSGGPDVVTGNGYTAFAALSYFGVPEQPIRLWSGLSSKGATLFIFTTSHTWAIFGSGTLKDPFSQPVMYMNSAGILGYDALWYTGSTFTMMGNTSKVESFDPGAGWTEIGFPIGDQFKNVTTGGGGKIPSGAPRALYSPATAFVSLADLGSGDTGLYVADGAVGWFRMSPVASPESGYVWSPRAVLAGGTSAVQAVETTPGITQLLIGPASSGPILFRDSSVNADWVAGSPSAYEPYPSYDTKGNIVLCQSGEVAEIAHIGVKSIAVGAKPAVGLLLGEIAPSTAAPFDWLDVTSNDPPDLPASNTLYSDRYTAMQNNVCPKCDNFQLCLDYGTQDEPDEMLLFSVYGAKHAERRQQ